MYNSMEYLHIRLDVDAIHREKKLVTASLRVYHDPSTVEEKLAVSHYIKGIWALEVCI